MTNSLFLSKKNTLWIFLYSLAFLGTTIKYISVLSIFLVLPFTGGAWIAGVAAASLFKTNYAYLPAAWFAVFMQAYVAATLIHLMKLVVKKRRATKVAPNGNS